jgi:putative methionine-R-sulfoxide reductase with GAF domain
MQVTCSEVAVPILLEGDLFGVLDVESSKPGKFTSDDVLWLELVAKQLALALKNAHIFRQSEEIRRQLLALMESARLLSLPLDRERNLQAILREACRLTGAHCAVYLVKNEQGLRVDQVYPLHKRADVIRGIRDKYDQEIIPLDSPCLAAETARSGKPKVVSDACLSAMVEEDGAAEPTCSRLVVPILEKREVKGVLRLEHSEIGGLNQAHLDIIRALAGFLQNTERILELAEERQRAEKHRILQLSSRLRLATLEEISSLVGDIDGRLDNLRRAFQMRKMEQVELQLSKAQTQANKLCKIVGQLLIADQEEEIKLLPIAALLEELVLSWRSLYPRVTFQLINPPPPNCVVQARSSEIHLAFDFLGKIPLMLLKDSRTTPGWFQSNVA